MRKNITERQQIRVWLDESDIEDKSENMLNYMFKKAMMFKNAHSNVTLKQAYSYAYMTYVNEN